MNFENIETNYKEHNNLKKTLNKSKHDAIEQYKSMICPSCVHYKDVNYQECEIVTRVDGQAGCVNYMCKEYCRNKEKKN